MAKGVICTVNIKKVTLVEAEETFSKIPDRKIGQWTKLFEEMKKDGKPVELSDITAGQIAALKRKAKETGNRVKSFDHGKKVIVLPPAKAGK